MSVGSRILALNTVQRNTGVALLASGETPLVYEEEGKGRRSAYLLSVIDTHLGEKGWALEDLDAIAVCVGPGTFTGIRVGMAVARALAHAAGLPLVGVSAFDAYEAQYSPGERLLIALDARRGEVYSQYRYAGQGKVETWTQTPEETLDILVQSSGEEAIHINGDAVGMYGEIWGKATGVELAESSWHALGVEAIARIGLERLALNAKGLDPIGIQPSYIRRSDKDLQLK